MAGSFHVGYRRQPVLASASRTATTTSTDKTCPGNWLRIRTRITVVPGTAPSNVTKVQRKNPDGTYTDVLAGAAMVAVGEQVLEIGPGLATTANVSANALIGGPFRVVVTAGNANAATYNVTMESF
jgi:hypothetical protein